MHKAIYRLSDGFVIAWGTIAVPEWYDPAIHGIAEPGPGPEWLDVPSPYRWADGSYHAEPEV